MEKKNSVGVDTRKSGPILGTQTCSVWIPILDASELPAVDWPALFFLALIVCRGVAITLSHKLKTRPITWHWTTPLIRVGAVGASSSCNSYWELHP